MKMPRLIAHRMIEGAAEAPRRRGCLDANHQVHRRRARPHAGSVRWWMRSRGRRRNSCFARSSMPIRNFGRRWRSRPHPACWTGTSNGGHDDLSGDPAGALRRFAAGGRVSRGPCTRHPRGVGLRGRRGLEAGREGESQIQSVGHRGHRDAGLRIEENPRMAFLPEPVVGPLSRWSSSRAELHPSTFSTRFSRCPPAREGSRTRAAGPCRPGSVPCRNPEHGARPGRRRSRRTDRRRAPSLSLQLHSEGEAGPGRRPPRWSVAAPPRPLPANPA